MADFDYISSSDITDKVLDGLATEAYVAEGNDAIEDLAEVKGIRSTSDIGDGAGAVHNRVKRYGVAYCCMRIAQDHMAVNNVDVPELEKYVIKYNIYRKEVAQLKTEISREMILDDVDEMRDRATMRSGVIFRG